MNHSNQWGSKFSEIYHDKSQDGLPYAGDPLYDRLKNYIESDFIPKETLRDEIEKAMPITCFQEECNHYHGSDADVESALRTLRSTLLDKKEDL